MKLLYCLVVLGLIQYGLTAVPMTPSRQQQKLLQVFKQEMAKLMKEHFARVKQFFEKVLQDDTIKQNTTPTFQYFKKYANQFLQQYQSASQIELQEIFFDFFYSTILTNRSDDVKYIVMYMNRNGYEELKTIFEKSFVSIVKEKFIPLFEGYKKQCTPKELKQQWLLMEWFKDLKACSSYYCYSYRLDEYPDILDSIFGSIGKTYVYHKLY